MRIIVLNLLIMNKMVLRLHMEKFLGLVITFINFLFGLLISGAKLYIDSFTSIIFSHTCRLGSFISHNLTRHVRHVSGLYVWIENVPPHLNVVLLSDYG